MSNEVQEIRQQLKRAQEKIAELQQENEELKRRLLAYENENTPPSMLKKMGRRRFKKKPAGRKPGHEGTTRATPEPDVVVDWKLDSCPDCGNLLPKTSRTYSRTVEDITLPRHVTIKYLINESWCPTCHKMVKKPVPAKGRFGYNSHLFATYLRYQQRVPVRGVVETLNDFCSLDVTPSTVLDMTQRTSMEFSQVYDDIAQEIRSSDVCHADETSWRVDGMNWWNWVFATQDAAFYYLSESRGKKTANTVMDGFEGTLVTDGYNAYSKFEDRQQCWAHILRRSKRLKETKQSGGTILHKRLKNLYNNALKGGFTEAELLKQLDTICNAHYGDKKCRKLVAWLQNFKGQLFRFVSDPSVPPNNNHAERLMRPVVVSRKISGGNRSKKGVKALAVMTSVMATWRLQDKYYFAEARRHLSRQLSGG